MDRSDPLQRTPRLLYMNNSHTVCLYLIALALHCWCYTRLDQHVHDHNKREVNMPVLAPVSGK